MKFRSKIITVFSLAVIFFFVSPKSFAATYTVCSSGCNATIVSTIWANNDLGDDDIIELRADTPGGTKTFAALGMWGSNDGGSLGHPVTLRGRAGDTIIIDATSTSYGTYTSGVSYLTIENIEWRNATAANFYINGGSSYITFNNCSSSGVGRAIRTVNSASNITLNNFTANHNTVSAPVNGIIEFFDGSNITLNHVTVTQNTTDVAASGIYSAATSTVSLNDVEITGSPTHGLQIYGVTSGTVDLSNMYIGVTRSGVIDGNNGQGIYAIYTATSTMTNINISSSTGHGLHFAGGANPLTINNATTSYNTGNGINLLSFTGPVVLSNIYSHHNTSNGIGLSTLTNFIYTNGVTNHNGGDGVTTSGGSIGTVARSTSNYNGTYGTGVSGGTGDGFTSHSTDNINYNYNISTNNMNTGFAHTITSTGKISNNIVWSNGSTTDSSMVRCQMYITTTANPGFIIKNNIIGQGGIYNDSCEYRPAGVGTSYNVLDYNLYNPVNNNSFAILPTGTTSWSTWHATNETNSNIGNPYFVSETDFHLRELSPAIDAGTNLGLTTDYSGNTIFYGAPDLGVYEYQPPYTFALNNMPKTGSIRLYSDGKYRIKTATTSSDLVSFSVTPGSGSYLATTTQYMDIQINNWEISGDKNKEWSATSTSGNFMTLATSTIYTIGDLIPSQQYTFKLDGIASSTAITGYASTTCSDGVCTSDSSGVIQILYTGGYSSHTFALEKVADSVVVDNTPQMSTSRSGSYYTPWMIKQTVPNTASSSINSNTISIKLTKNLKLEQNNDQVKILQKFLNDNGFIISKTGAGSPGKETSYFGSLTKKAVIKFQEKYAKDILKPAGLKKGNGIVGPKTRGKMNELMRVGLQ